jgi:4-amino-4-deoxy-L-arabinose transferase-like glycosyltransferase
VPGSPVYAFVAALRDLRTSDVNTAERVGHGVYAELMEGVERVWHRRLRWRLRGAWMWPAFLALTVVDGILLVVLPPYDGAPPAVFPGVLLAGFVNLLAVAVAAPLLGVAVRRRRPDLPRMVAADYAGAWVLAAIAALIVLGGFLHRSAVREEEAREQAVAQAMHDYVVSQAPERQAGLSTIDSIRIEPDYYRACIPSDDRWFCLFVSTDQQPPGITRDTSQEPNRSWRPYGGFD